MDGLMLPSFRSRGYDKMSGLCPHCEEELELDISLTDWMKRPDTEFECPHYGGEFSFHTWRKWRGLKSEFKWIFGNPLTWNHRPFWLLSLTFILAGSMGMGTGSSDWVSVLFLVVSLAVFLFTTFIEIRNLFPFLPWWHLGVGIAAGIALIAIISFGWPALLVVGIVLIIYAAIGWAKE